MHALLKPHVAIALTLASISACGSDSTGPGGGNGDCTITLSGAETGSPACSGVTALWSSDDNTFVFGFFTTLGGTPTVIVSASSPGQPAKMSYHLTDAGAIGSAALGDGSSGWEAYTADGSVEGTASGSYELTITSISTIASAAGGKVYAVHGTYTATLEPKPDTDATGTVTISATF